MFPNTIIVSYPYFGDRNKVKAMADNCDKDFHTLKGYQLISTNKMTNSMEDYLEMICRHAQMQDYVRMNVLAADLHVKPSSASKMVTHLKDLGLVEFEKYGMITLTQEGWELGRYLLYRHEVLHQFLCLVNHSKCELEQVEKIEHFFNKETVTNIETLVKILNSNKPNKI